MGGIYLFTELIGLQYMWSKICIATLIGFLSAFLCSDIGFINDQNSKCSRSTLPPDTTIPTFFDVNSSLAFKTAANATALDGSMTIFILFHDQSHSLFDFLLFDPDYTTNRFLYDWKIHISKCVLNPSAIVCAVLILFNVTRFHRPESIIRFHWFSGI